MTETIDKGHDVPVYSEVCSFCIYLKLESVRACKAFPGGIPLDIWKGKNKHTDPFPRDNGIRSKKA